MTAILSLFLFFLSLSPAKDKLAPDELVKKHLDSIGTPEARAAIRSRTVEGQVVFSQIGNTQHPAMGHWLMFSEGRKLRNSLIYDFADYKGEDMVSDGDKFFVGFAILLNRSPLGELLNNHPQVLKEGLVGGVLGTSWALLDVAGREPRLQYRGTKKIDGKEVHVLGYTSKRPTLVTVNLYFDAETFSHVRTTYALSREYGGPYDVTETFAQFQSLDGVTLPGLWTINVNFAGDNAKIWEWKAAATKVVHNASIDPKQFEFAAHPK